MTTVIEAGRVAPPPGTVAEQSLPLTFLDIIWLTFHPMCLILFYDLPISKPRFLEIIVPKLKQSLSLALKHFFPLSGYVVHPLSPEELPIYRDRPGDSIPITISECSDDFDDLVRNHAQSDKFYCLIPQLSPIVEESDHKLFQVLAVQVTLFAGRGISIGIATHHCASDAPSFLSFLTTWASINKNRGDDEELSLPIFDRSLINYPLKYDSIFWKDIKKSPLQLTNPTLPTNRIRSTYSFTQSEIKKLKNLIQEKVPSLVHLSSFVAVAAYIWTAMAKSLLSEADVETEKDDDTFVFIPIDLRPQLNPPVPENYFGNCLSILFTSVGWRELAGDEGLFVAAEAIAAEIKKSKSDKNILENDMEKWWVEMMEANAKSFFSISGSTRLDIYGLDFGWGKARKHENLSTDKDEYSMSLCKPRDFEGVEICMSLPKEKMDAFDAYFYKGMKCG